VPEYPTATPFDLGFLAGESNAAALWIAIPIPTATAASAHCSR
jgi:hypothetical protein